MYPVLSLLERGKKSFVWYCLIATLVAATISLALVASAAGLAELLGLSLAEASAPELDATAVEFLSVVVVSPVVETVLLVLMLKLFSRPFPTYKARAAVAAIAWGALHGLFGWLWFFGTVWSFFVFSMSYFAWFEKSSTLGFIAAAVPHAALNFIVMLTVVFNAA